MPPSLSRMPLDLHRIVHNMICSERLAESAIESVMHASWPSGLPGFETSCDNVGIVALALPPRRL